MGSMAGTGWATPERSSRFYNDAAARVEKEDIEGALVQLRNAIKEDANNLSAQLLLGKLLLRTGQLKAAEAAFETARRLGVSPTEIAVPMGQLYLQMGMTAELLDKVKPDGLPVAAQVEVLTMRGSALALDNRFADALKAYAQARQLDPKSPLPDIAEAPVLLRQGERDKARATALRATAQGPRLHTSWYQYGTVLLGLGEPQPALAAFDKAVALAPKHVDSHVGRASSLMLLGRSADAATTLKMLKAEGASEPRASLMRGLLAEGRGDANTAKAEFVDAAAMIDAMPPNVRNASEPLLLVGVIAHRALGQQEKLREYLDAVLARNSRHIPAMAMLTELLLASGELPRATTAAEALLRIAPNDGQALYLMGSVLLAKRQFGPAAEFLERAAKASPNSAALRDLSQSQFGLGQPKEALANLEAAYKKNPRDTLAGMSLAVTYARMGNNAQAVKIAEDIVKRDPNNLALATFLANVKGRTGDKAGLKTVLESVLAKDPLFRPAVMNLSWLDMEQGRLDAARARLKGFLKTQPKDPDVLFQLGMLERQARRPDEAIAAWTEGDRAQTKDPRHALALIDLRLSARQNAEALTLARTTAARYPDVPQAHLLLARVQMGAGDTSLARSSLQEASRKADARAPEQLEIGRLYLQLGAADDARFVANKMLQAEPNDPQALTLAVEAAGRKGDAAGVDAAMAQLRSRHPQHLLTLTTAGHIALSRGQFDAALQQYQAAFAKEPSTPLALTLAQAHLARQDPAKAVDVMQAWSAKQPADLLALRALADFQLLAGRAAPARANYERLVKQLPNDAQVLGAYARVLADTKDPTALATAEKAYRMAPTQTPLADLYGRLLVDNKQVDAGIKVLRDARLRDPQNGNLRMNLAGALVQAGRRAEAREELQAALNAPNPPQDGPRLQQVRAAVGL